MTEKFEAHLFIKEAFLLVQRRIASGMITCSWRGVNCSRAFRGFHAMNDLTQAVKQMPMNAYHVPSTLLYWISFLGLRYD